jgi:uncharacterized membrane protein YfcA
MFNKILLLTIAGILGSIAGWYGGYLYYQATKPSYGQFGYEFDGFSQALAGAGVGLILSVLFTYIFLSRHKS